MMQREYLDVLQTETGRWRLLLSCRANPPSVLASAQELLLQPALHRQLSDFDLSDSNFNAQWRHPCVQDVQSTQTASRGRQQGSNLTKHKHTPNCKQPNPATAWARVDLPI